MTKSKDKKKKCQTNTESWGQTKLLFWLRKLFFSLKPQLYSQKTCGTVLFGWLTFCRTKPCNFFWACKLHRNSPSQLLRLIAAKQGRTSFRIRCRGLGDTFVRVLPPLGQLRRGCFLFYTLGLSGLRRKGGQGCRSGRGGDHKWIEGRNDLWTSEKPESFKSTLLRPNFNRVNIWKEQTEFGIKWFHRYTGGPESKSREWWQHFPSAELASFQLQRVVEKHGNKALCNLIPLQHQTHATNKTTRDEVKGHKNSWEKGATTQYRWKRGNESFSCQNFFDGHPILFLIDPSFKAKLPQDCDWFVGRR